MLNFVGSGKVVNVSGCIDSEPCNLLSKLLHLLTSNGLHFRGNLRLPPQCTTKTPE